MEIQFHSVWDGILAQSGPQNLFEARSSFESGCSQRIAKLMHHCENQKIFAAKLTVLFLLIKGHISG